MTKSELCPSTFPKPWVGCYKTLGVPLTLGGIFQKPGWTPAYDSSRIGTLPLEESQSGTGAVVLC